MKKQPYIVILPVDSFDRKDHAESIENQHFNTTQELYDALGFDEGFRIYSLTDFMDEFNDDYIGESNSWLTYITLTK